MEANCSENVKCAIKNGQVGHMILIAYVSEPIIMKSLIMLENVPDRKSIKMQQYSSYRELADV